MSEKNIKHTIKKVGRKILSRIYPFSKVYSKLDELHHIDNLKERIASLEERNEEWAAEVRTLRGDDKSLDIIWPAEAHLIAKARPVKQYKGDFTSSKPRIAFIIPPADPGSGGHTTIFRFVAHLESKGYEVSLYIYDPLHSKKPGEAKRIIVEHFRKMNAKIYEGTKGIDEFDIVFATNWTTVFPLVNSKAKNTKFYFVQDFEPWFEPVGSYQRFIEQTYKFNLYGITAGNWLAGKLSADYNMQCESFSFGVDLNIYKDLHMPRKDICFYARPGSPRRGFEMGVLVLEQLQKKHPDLTIHCYGGDLSRYELPFNFINHGVADHKTLNEIYNKCRVGLVFSFTNMSLTPQEILASGCIPVVNDAKNNTEVFSNDYIAFVEPEVQKLVAACEDILYNKKASYFSKAAKHHGSGKWENTWDEVEKFMINKASK